MKTQIIKVNEEWSKISLVDGADYEIQNISQGMLTFSNSDTVPSENIGFVVGDFEVRFIKKTAGFDIYCKSDGGSKNIAIQQLDTPAPS